MHKLQDSTVVIKVSELKLYQRIKYRPNRQTSQQRKVKAMVMIGLVDEASSLFRAPIKRRAVSVKTDIEQKGLYRN